MDIQLKASKSITTLVFYVTDDRYTEAKAAIDEMKPILEKHGFLIETIREGATKGHN